MLARALAVCWAVCLLHAQASQPQQPNKHEDFVKMKDKRGLMHQHIWQTLDGKSTHVITSLREGMTVPSYKMDEPGHTFEEYQGAIEQQPSSKGAGKVASNWHRGCMHKHSMLTAVEWCCCFCGAMQGVQ